MAFQSTVNLYRGFGIIGEKFSDAPSVATTYNLTTSGHQATHYLLVTYCRLIQ